MWQGQRDHHTTATATVTSPCHKSHRRCRYVPNHGQQGRGCPKKGKNHHQHRHALQSHADTDSLVEVARSQNPHKMDGVRDQKWVPGSKRKAAVKLQAPGGAIGGSLQQRNWHCKLTCRSQMTYLKEGCGGLASRSEAETVVNLQDKNRKTTHRELCE